MLFVGDDGITGDEPWSVDPGAHASPFGHGCAVGIPPRLTGTQPRLGRSFEIRVDVTGSSAGPRGALVLDAIMRRPVPLGFGCSLFVDPATALLQPFILGANGYRIVVQVPNLPSPHGLNLPVQAGVGPTANPPLGLDLTNGLLLAVRR